MTTLLERSRRRWLARLFAGLVLLGALPARADDRWYELLVAGSPSGYAHESTVVEPTGLSRSSSEIEVAVVRLGSRVEFGTHDIYTEGTDGTLRHLHSESRSSKDATTLDVDVGRDELTIVTEAGGREYRRVEPVARRLLGPEGIRVGTLRALADGRDSFQYATFESDLGKVVEVTRRFVERPAADAPPRIVVTERIEGIDPPARLVLDGDGEMLEMSQAGPFGEMKIVLATEAVRDRPRTPLARGDDLFTRLLVPANVRLPEPRAIDELRVRLDLRDVATGFPELEAPGQHVLERAPDHVVLAIRRPSVTARPGPDAAPGAPFTDANVILQADHPDVVALAATLRRPGIGAYAQARVLQDWVAEHMRFDAGLAVVPASEAVRDRGGTCVAYAVLLTSLARALGIPARLVSGYAYLENAWAGHAWSEIRVGPRWVPLDATLWSPGPADAARIAVVHHDAENGAGTGTDRFMRLLGNVSIRVLGYRHRGRWVDVPEDAAPQRIDGDRYQNPWLGLRLTKPANFRFASADARYPDPTVISMRAPDGGELRVLELAALRTSLAPRDVLAELGFGGEQRAVRVAGRPALRTSGDAAVAVAFRDGEDLWVLAAAGGTAATELDAVAASVVLDGPPPAARAGR